VEEENKKFQEENENTIYQNLWETMKAVLKGKFISMSACIGESELSNK
jgi:hypothetical protein